MCNTRARERVYIMVFIDSVILVSHASDEHTELKTKHVKAVVKSYLELAAGELKKNSKFKVGGVLNMKLKKKLAWRHTRNEPFHQGTLCLQGQASEQDCSRLAHEEAQADD